MKQIMCLLSVLVLLFSIASCAILEDRQSQILETLGDYETKRFWTDGGSQDYTDFGIYTYQSVNLEGNEYFKKLSDDTVDTFLTFIDDFEGWVELIGTTSPESELAKNYSFDRALIDAKDYFYIYEDEDYNKFGCYDLWLFDSQTNTLYYFHNNT